MYATALIVFREILEAGLIIGIVLAATQNIEQRGRWVFGGVLAGLLGAAATAGVADHLMEAMEGMGQEVFNASILLVAVVMLGWHSIWMQKHGRELAGKLRNYGESVRSGDRHISALAVVICLAVLREGAEVVLFLHGVSASGGEGTGSMLAGGVMGIAGGVLVGYLLYRGLLRIPSKYLFQVTTGLILLLAAGMAAQAARYLEMANVLPSLGGAVWNTAAILPDHSIVGQVLHTLIGYTAQPNVLQLLAYALTLTIIIALMKLSNRPNASPTLTASVSAGVVFVIAMLVGVGYVNNAEASHKVYSPHVEKGELELEIRGHVDQDDDPALDKLREDIYEIGYGFTERWFSSIFVEFEKAPGQSYENEATAWENIYVLTEPGQYWADFGLYFEYEVPKESEDPEKIELKLLIEKDIHRWVHTANLIVESEFGGEEEDETEFGIAWRSSYKLKPTLEPGIELYSEENITQVGPAVTGVFKFIGASKIGYTVGYLFGASDDTPDGTFTWALELESYF